MFPRRDFRLAKNPLLSLMSLLFPSRKTLSLTEDFFFFYSLMPPSSSRTLISRRPAENHEKQPELATKVSNSAPRLLSLARQDPSLELAAGGEISRSRGRSFSVFIRLPSVGLGFHLFYAFFFFVYCFICLLFIC